MNDALRRQLQDEVGAVERQLIAAVPPLDDSLRSQLEGRLVTLQTLLNVASENHRRQQFLQAGVLIISSMILALGMALHLSSANLRLGAHASALSFTTLANAAQDRGYSNKGNVDVTTLIGNFANGRPALHKEKARITNLEIRAGTRVDVMVTEGHCFSLSNANNAGQAGGHWLALSYTTPADSTSNAALAQPASLAPVSDLLLEELETVSFCPVRTADILLVAKVTDVHFWSVYTQGPLHIRLPSILSGKLRVVETGETLELGPSDRIDLAGLQDGWLVVSSGDGAAVSLSGSARTALLVGAIEGGETTNLVPSLARYVTSAPDLVWGWGSLLGLLGLIWSLLAFLK